MATDNEGAEWVEILGLTAVQSYVDAHAEIQTPERVRQFFEELTKLARVTTGADTQLLKYQLASRAIECRNTITPIGIGTGTEMSYRISWEALLSPQDRILLMVSV